MIETIEVIERYEIPIIPDLDLPEEDGVPLETNWHRAQINLLIDVITHRWRDRTDFFVGGNMFIYYSLRQARNRDYKGPDLFLVKDVDGTRPRGKWVVWEEDGRFPDAIVELMSPSTAAEDLGRKKGLYERTFHTPGYFAYDPDADRLFGWRLLDQAAYGVLSWRRGSAAGRVTIWARRRYGCGCSTATGGCCRHRGKRAHNAWLSWKRKTSGCGQSCRGARGIRRPNAPAATAAQPAETTPQSPPAAHP
jgi:Uma2 family endonuclease